MRTLHLLLAAVCWLAGTTLATAQQDKPRRSDAAELLKRLDKNQDGFLQPAELPAPVQNRFEKLDRNQDGKLSEAELQRVAPRLAQLVGPPPAAPPPDLLFRLLDANNDGKLSRDELENAAKVLEKLDRKGWDDRAGRAGDTPAGRAGRPPQQGHHARRQGGTPGTAGFQSSECRNRVTHACSQAWRARN
jgi:hypothetical protein